MCGQTGDMAATASTSPIDAHLQLAFAMQSNPGSYALLIGAGVSVASGAPSAWEIQTRLIRQIAETRNKFIPVDEEVLWWTRQTGAAPTYNAPLEQVAPGQMEWLNFLRPQFEPSEQDVAVGRKVPTNAHRSIAQLVGHGAVRVVVTVNFDCLIETALRDVGIEPVVCSIADAIQGMTPLHSQRALVVHLHGDYLEPTMRNTLSELESYPHVVNSFLEQVLDEYGLVIAGWSARWDVALRKAVLKSSNRGSQAGG